MKGEDKYRVCLPDPPTAKRMSKYIDKDPQIYDSDAMWREAIEPKTISYEDTRNSEAPLTEWLCEFL